jgi:hypothetical protein
MLFGFEIAAGEEPVCGMTGHMAVVPKQHGRTPKRDRQAWNGPTAIALLGKELGQVINLQSAENKDGKPTPGGKVYTGH